VIVKLGYGEDRLAVDLRGFKVRTICPSAPAGRDAGELAAEALASPLEGRPLIDLVRGQQRVTIVVPDATRKASLPDVLPAVLAALRRAGISDSSITVLVANGTHPRVGLDRLEALLGQIPQGLRVVEHDSRAPDLVRVGELRPGVAVHLHPAAVDCDFLMTVSAVRHHYFAGFGGGPKMVFPGVGGYREIQANHALVLDSVDGRALRHPKCEPGVLEGNPIAEEIHRAVELRPPDFALCLVEGREGGMAWAGAGPWAAAFEAAVDRVRQWFEVPPETPFELMVACAGGAPTDTTLIQAHKSLDAACRFLEPDGEILWVACLDGGLGSHEMAPFVRDPSPEKILASLSSTWVQYGHTTLRIVEKTSRHRVGLYSSFDPRDAERLGFRPLADPEKEIERWRAEYAGARVGVMASGAVLPRS
jgi:nickel-dependent lactate racemase